MRHNKKINHLGRTASHRKAMLSNMAASLILHKKIVTTLAKAKALRLYVEPLITKSKDDSVHSRRTVFSYLQNKIAVKELFLNVATKVADRPGGYTRILKTGNRLGDNAEMCLIELVDYNELLLKDKDTKKSKTTRRSRSKKSQKDELGTSEPKETKKSTKESKTAETETNPVENQEVVEDKVTEIIAETSEIETQQELEIEEKADVNQTSVESDEPTSEIEKPEESSDDTEKK